MPRKRSALVVIALYWLGLTLAVAVLVGIAAYVESPSRPPFEQLPEALIGPVLCGWVFYGVVPSFLLLLLAVFLRAFRLRDRRPA